MKIGVKVGDIMTRNFSSIKPEATLINAAKEMIKKRVGSLVVLDKDELKGLITERDIIWAMVKKSSGWNKILVKDIAKRKVHTINPSTDLLVALQKMKNTGYRWLPVTVKKRVIGLLTLKDILRVEPSLFETAQEIMQIKEETAKLKRIQQIKSGKVIEGICNECGNTDILQSVNGRLVCEECKFSI